MRKIVEKLRSFIFHQTGKSEYNRVLRNNVLAAFLIKGLSLFVSLFTVPVFMRFFSDAQVLGLWFTMLSLLTWVLNFDLGIGNGLRNQLVQFLSMDNRNTARELISSAYIACGLFVAFLGVIGLAASGYIDWNSVFAVDVSIVKSATLLHVTRIIYIGLMLQFLLRLISSVLYALQKSAVNNLISLFTSILQLLYVLSLPSVNSETNLIRMSYGFVFSTNIPLIIASIFVFRKGLPGCFPSVRYFKTDSARKVLSIGGVFFWCQIMYMLIMNSNDLFISHFVGTSMVVDYQVYNRLFSIVGTLVFLALSPVWSLITKAMADGDYAWIRKVYNKAMKVCLLLSLSSLLLIPLLQPILDIWLGDQSIEVNHITAFIFSLFGMIFLVQTVISTVVCGLGRMKNQAIFYTIAVAAKIVIIYLLFMISNNWVNVVIANILIFLPYIIVDYFSVRSYLHRMQGTEIPSTPIQKIGEGND